MKTTRAYAPASIGNISLGFDVLGAALQPLDGSLLGDEVIISDADEYGLTVAGVFAHKLPANADENIVTDCYHFFVKAMQARNLATTPVHITLLKSLPIGSGLGSSASSIVACWRVC